MDNALTVIFHSFEESFAGIVTKIGLKVLLVEFL